MQSNIFRAIPPRPTLPSLVLFPEEAVAVRGVRILLGACRSVREMLLRIPSAPAYRSNAGSKAQALIKNYLSQINRLDYLPQIDLICGDNFLSNYTKLKHTTNSVCGKQKSDQYIIKSVVHRSF